MAYERIILDIETTNLLEPMIDFTQRPLALKPDAKLWCIAVKCIDTNNSFVMIPPEILEEIEQGKYQDTPEIEEEYSKITIVPLTKDRLDKMFSNIVKTFIGHNIIKFDLPALKLFGLLDYDIGYPYYEELNNSFKTETTINGKEIDICDTLVLSKLLNADRFGGHSLKNFGKNNGLEKMEFEKFDSFSKHMVVYCLRDVNVNHDAYNALIDEKGDYEGWDKPYTMEAKLADLVLKQELFGFEYDLELSAKNKLELDKLLEDRYNTVTPNIPPKPLNIGEAKQWTPPKIKFSKTSNSISSHMTKFLDKIGAEYNPFTNKYTFENKEYDLYYDGPVKETLPASIKDLAHLKGYLISLGWTPSQWNIRDLTRDSKKKVISKDKFLATVDRYVEDTFEGPFKELRLKELELSLKKTTPEKLKEFLIEQYNDKRVKPIRVPTTPPFRVGATKDLCPNLEALAENGTIPFVKDMVEYFTYTHRRNSISGGVDEETGEPSKGFESYIREDGRIGTPVDSNATNTSRMAHKVVCNIPRVSSLYGGNMRALFAVGNNQLQYGYDYSSLENRIQGHYIYNYEGGPELAETLLADKPNDVHCFSSDTEILTENGWMTFDNINTNIKVAQWTTENTIQFVEPTEVVWQYYKGGMVNLESNNLSLLVTPNHRMIYKQVNSNYKETVASSFIKNNITSDVRIPLSGVVTTTKLNIDSNLCKLIVATQADGYLLKDCSGIKFEFKKERKIERLISILDSLKTTYTIKTTDKNTTIIYVKSSKITMDVRFYLTQTKDLSFNLLKLNTDNLSTLLEEVKFWDGTVKKSNIILDTTSKDTVDILQAISHLLNYKATVNTYNKTTTYGETTIHRLTLSLKAKPLAGVLSTKYKTIQYDGFIGCVAVPSTYIVIRRNGKVSISGNTINSKKLGISRDNAKALTYALLYGAAAPKLQKMLDLDKEGAEKMYEDFWNSVLPLKMFRDDATKFWESTGKEYILGIDGRKFHVRSAHSIVNLLFQSAGSLSMKYGVILSSQMLEEQNYLGNLLEDSKEESENKVNEMILYHDECQYAIPKSWYHPVYFDNKEEAENYRIENNMCTPVHYSEKLSKFYLDGQNQLTDIILEAIQNVIKILRLKVDLGIEWSIGLNWRDTH